MFFPSSANTTSKANKIRVLHVINALDHGGAEVYAMQLIAGLRVHGVDSHLAFTHQGTMTNRAARLGVPMAHVSRHLFSFRSPLRSLLAMVRLYQYIRRQGIRVVHAHIFEPYFWVAPAAWFAGVPLIRTVVGTRRDAQWWAPLPERLLARITTAFVVFSGASKAEIKGFGVEDRRIHTIPNGVSFNLGTLPDIDDRARFVKETLGLSGKFVVGFVGRLHWMKGPTVFLEAAERIAKHIPDVHFVMDGVGPMDAEVRQSARGLGLADRVSFTGLSEDVLGLIRSFDVLVLSSFSEGMPTVLLEAMGLGVPVVATSVGSVPEVIRDRVHGRVVLPRIPEAISHAVVDLLNSPDEASKMARRARKRCDEFFHFSEISRRVHAVYVAANSGTQ